MKDIPTGDLVPILFISFAVLIALSYFLLRWIFSVPRQLKNQERTEKILGLIALKLGVAESDIPVPPVD